jgi:hypothetical protein
MTLTLTILLGFFLGAALILALSLQYRERQRWMRMFSEKQGIPIDIMEGKDRGAQAGAPAHQANKDHRKRFPVPIPGADWMRNPKGKQHPTADLRG